MGKAAKRQSDSYVESRYLIMPNDANQYGTVFGGVTVAYIDMVGSMAAQKHCGKVVVTASIDSLSFEEPINIGEHVVLKAWVNYVGRTSMEVEVQVYRENPQTGRISLATIAYLTYVALDKNRKPTKVGPLLPVGPQEEHRYKEAEIRVKARKELIKKIRDCS